MLEKIYKGFLHSSNLIAMYFLARSFALGDGNWMLPLAISIYFIYRLATVEYVERKASEAGLTVDEYLKTQKRK